MPDLGQFLDPLFIPDNIASYIARTSILRAIKHYVPQFRGVVLDVGCGQMPYRSLIVANPKVKRYIGLDFATGLYARRQQPDITWDGKHIPMDDNSVDCALATEVFEHVPEPACVMQEIHRVLKPNGLLFFTVPFLWPLHDVPHDEYRYTPFALRRLLNGAGFDHIDVQALGGWNASLAQVLGLWLNGAPMSTEVRAHYRDLVFPWCKRLLEEDRLPEQFTEGTLISGLAGIAWKRKAMVSISSAVPQSKARRVCVIGINRNAVSETFIRAHVERMPATVDYLYGGGFPSYRGDDQLLPPPLLPEQALQYRFGRSLAFRSQQIQPLKEQALKRFLRTHKIEAVLAEYGPTGVRVMDVCRELRIPLVVHFHGFDAYVEDVIKGEGRRYPQLFAQTAGIIAVSRDMEAQLLRLGALRERLHYVPCGADTSRFYGADPASAPPLFVAVGRFTEKKAPQLTLMAFKLVVEQCPEARLIMIGDGTLWQATKHLAQALNLTDHVTFTGASAPPEVAATMRRARAFVHHAIRTDEGEVEGTPVVVMEAGAAGLPVVSTRHAGIKDVIVENETGLLVDEKDVAGMACAMLRLAENPELAAQLGLAARQRIEAHFSLDVTMSKLWQVMENAIQQ